jgi:hypothetical protein
MIPSLHCKQDQQDLQDIQISVKWQELAAMATSMAKRGKGVNAQDHRMRFLYRQSDRKVINQTPLL